MLSISAMSGGQGAYYTGLAREDYYLEGGEPPGLWLGKGADLLGISGQVDKEVFASLFGGRDEHGNDLVQNAGGRSRQPGWDLTFSVPKSVSVAWSQAPAIVGAEIRAAHEAAVRSALAYLQECAAFTRRGKGGASHEKAGLVIGLFEHGTSRAQDPQLHTHAIVLNIGTRSDGTTGTIESKPLYEHKMAAGALYRAELAAQLEKRLGLECEKVRTWFELKGVSKTLIEEFSKRRDQIEQALEKGGFSSARASEFANVTTREVKEHVAREELFGKWQAVGKELGWSVNELENITGQHLNHDTPEVAKALAVKAALDQITEQNSHFSERDLVRRTAEHAQGTGLSALDVLKGARDYLRQHAITLSPKEGHQLYTTPEMLELERGLLARIEASRKNADHQVSGRTLGNIFVRHPELRDEQREAVQHITTGKGSVAVVSGMAGTGKTTMLEAAREVWEAEGFKVRGTALSGKAADGLSNEAEIESCTIAKLIHEIDKDRNPLDSKVVLVVDEAGMVGTWQMARLTEEIEKAGAKLVLVGDAKQLQPVEAGGAFAVIGERLGEATMKDIKRQREGWHREAVKEMADGNTFKVLQAFHDRGLLSVSEDKHDARKKLIAAWQGQGIERPEDNLILAATNQDARILNREIQLLREAEGKLGTESVSGEGGRFHTGDRVLFTKNAAPHGIRNGAIGTLENVETDSKTLHVRLDTGRLVSVSLNDYDHVKLGYAVTTHKAQGMTAENTFVLTDEAMQDRELSYVQISRSRGATRIFTTELEAGDELARLSKLTHRSHQKVLATTMLPPELKLPQQPEWRPEPPTHHQELRHEISLSM